MSPRANDTGRIEILAVVIVLMLMMATIAWWVNLAPPPNPSESVADMMGQVLEDEVTILRETPLAPTERACNGKTLMDKLVNQAVGGNTIELERKLDAKLGEAAHTNVYVKSGDRRYPLVHSFDNAANAGSIHAWIANHSYSKIILANDAESGQDNMIVDVPSSSRWALLKPKGEAVRTTVTVDGTVVDHALEVSGLTAMLPEWSSDYETRKFAQNIAWVPIETAVGPQLAKDLLAVDLGVDISLYLRLEPGLTGATFTDTFLPIGLQLSVAIPAGWDLREDLTQDRNDKWAISATGSAERGWTVEFVLDETLTTAATVELAVTSPASPARPFDDFYAKLGHGSLGESTLLVSYPSSVQRDLPRVVYATTPYPVREGTDALFGVAFGNGGQDEVTVTKIDVEIPGGYDVDGYQTQHYGLGAELFADEPMTLGNGRVQDDNGGTWTRLSSRHWQWKGSVDVGGGKTEYWAYKIPFTTNKAESTSIQPTWDDGPTSTLTFPNGYTHTTRRWGPTPGVFRHAVPPASSLGTGTDGYPWDALGTQRTIQAHVVGNLFEQYANASYVTRAQSGDAVAMQSAVANSSFRSTARMVNAGSTASIVADVASLTALASTLGATSTTFAASLYSPNTLGCAPVMTWTREIQSLPHAAVRDIELWDPTGTLTPTAYLTGDDMRVYKLDQAGTVLWRRELESAGLVLEPANFGLLDKALLVGEANGQLRKLAATDGDPDWSIMIPRATWSTSKIPNSITSIAVDEPNQRALVATAQGALELRSAAGTLLGRVETVVPGEAYVQVGLAPNGMMFGMTNQWHVDRIEYDAQIGLTMTRSRWTGTHFALGTIGVVLNDAASTRILDYDSLEGDIRHTHGTIRLAVAGDATGDGVTDDVLALDNMDIVVVNGANGDIAWTYDAGSVTSGGTNAVGNFLAENQNAACTAASQTGIYPKEVECSVIAASNVVLALDARDGRVAIARRVNDANELLILTNAGTEGWTPGTRTLNADTIPTSLRLGPWNLNGGVATGTDDGTLTVHERTSGTLLLSTQPTEFAGRFSFHFPVPNAGLFGMHLMTGSLTWEDATGNEYSAHLMDTFEVVDSNGRPPVRPMYVVVFQTEDKGDPLTAGPG